MHGTPGDDGDADAEQPEWESESDLPPLPDSDAEPGGPTTSDDLADDEEGDAGEVVNADGDADADDVESGEDNDEDDSTPDLFRKEYSEEEIENAPDMESLNVNRYVDKRVSVDPRESDEHRVPSEADELRWLAGQIDAGDNVTTHVVVLDVRERGDGMADRVVVADETAATKIKVPAGLAVDAADEYPVGASLIVEGLNATTAPIEHYSQLTHSLETDVTVTGEWERDEPLGVRVDVGPGLANAAERYKYEDGHKAREMVVEELLDAHTIVDLTGTELSYIYDEARGVWVEDAAEVLDSILTENLPSGVNEPRVRNKIIANAFALTRERNAPVTPGVPDNTDNRYRIGVGNGVVDVREPIEGAECLLDDGPEHELTDKLPVEFDEDAECPGIDRTIGEICGGDEQKKKVIYEIFGHVMMRNYEARQAIVKLGPEESGKSFLDDVLDWLVGEDKVEAASIQKLMDGGFETAALKQSLAVVDDDASGKKLSEPEWLKKSVGTGKIRVDEKNISRETIRNSSTLILNANSPPDLGGTAEGVRSRILPIVFSEKFTANPDPTADDEHAKKETSELRDELKTSEEMSGLLNEAIKGAQRLIEDGWSDGRTAEERFSLYNEWAEDVESACRDLFTVETGAVTRKDHAYSLYVAHARSRGMEPTGKQQFWSLVRKSDLYVEFGQRNDGKRTVKHVFPSVKAMKIAPEPIREEYEDDVEAGSLSHPLDDTTPLADVKRWNDYATIEATVVARDTYQNGVVELTLRDESGAARLRAKPATGVSSSVADGSAGKPVEKLDGVNVGDVMRAEVVEVGSSGLSVGTATTIEVVDPGEAVNDGADTDGESGNAGDGETERDAAHGDATGDASGESDGASETLRMALHQNISWMEMRTDSTGVKRSLVVGKVSKSSGEDPDAVEDEIEAMRMDGLIEEPKTDHVRATTGEIPGGAD